MKFKIKMFQEVEFEEMEIEAQTKEDAIAEYSKNVGVNVFSIDYTDKVRFEVNK